MAGDGERRVFRFGVFEADVAAGELRKHGLRIKLHSQPFQVLVMLLEQPSVILTREEMRQRLWGNDTFVDFNHGLNSAINRVREALDDSASQPRYIETVSGKGYRFIAPVSSVELTAAAAEVETPVAVLSTREELPVASKNLVRALLLLIQTLYLAFYISALANLREIDEIFGEARLPASLLMSILVITAAALIPVRLFLFTAVAFDYRLLPAKFSRIFPVLLPLDLLWALSPFLLVHHIPFGLSLGMCAALVYLPFAQRALILMYADR